MRDAARKVVTTRQEQASRSAVSFLGSSGQAEPLILPFDTAQRLYLHEAPRWLCWDGADIE
jgi:hypothetical protein